MLDKDVALALVGLLRMVNPPQDEEQAMLLWRTWVQLRGHSPELDELPTPATDETRAAPTSGEATRVPLALFL